MRKGVNLLPWREELKELQKKQFFAMLGFGVTSSIVIVILIIIIVIIIIVIGFIGIEVTSIVSIVLTAVLTIS